MKSYKHLSKYTQGQQKHARCPSLFMVRFYSYAPALLKRPCFLIGLLPRLLIRIAIYLILHLIQRELPSFINIIGDIFLSLTVHPADGSSVFHKV
jgi:hypothetical protein